MVIATQGRTISQQARTIREELSEEFGFRDHLPIELIQDALDELNIEWRDCVYTPTVTLWTFLTQVLSADHSCQNAVNKLLVFLLTSGEKPCSPNTGPYCKARDRLSEEFVARLAREVGGRLHENTPAGELVGGRPIKLIDGSTVSMPDTPENQELYPQPKTQKKGLGFPIARLVAIISFYSGAILDLAIGPYKGKGTGENALLRNVWNQLSPGDVAAADRCYASYCNIAMLKQNNVDLVSRLHQKRHHNFRTGKRLGKQDHIVTWTKPEACPDWLDKETFEQLPDQLKVREIKIRVEVDGFRVREYILVTTLLDAPKEELAAIFRIRWHVELDIRSIKSVMQMDVLRCKTPPMIRKEIWVHLLGYNLIRCVMADAAQKHDLSPRDISFKAALQTVNAFLDVLHLIDPKDVPAFYQIMLDAIARHRVGKRPNRCEPRAVKRRPKPHPLLRKPREQARMCESKTLTA